MSNIVRKPVSRVWTRVDTNHSVQPKKMARGLKFWIKKVEPEGLYYLCSDEKGTDQLHGYCQKPCSNPGI